MAPRGPYANGIATREEILAAALDHFVRAGYDRTSVREVARDAGVSQAGLLYHFPTKEELFLEVLRWRAERDAPVNPSLVSFDVLMNALEVNRREPGLARLYVLMSAESTIEDGPIHEYFRDRYATVVARMAEDLRDAQSRGEVSAAVDADAAASLLVAAADGLQVQWLLNPDALDVTERMRQLWSLLHLAP
jgi:AcrR family transcriptional regulator